MSNGKKRGNIDVKNTALDLYTAKAFRFIVILAPLVAVFSAVGYTVGYSLGWYPDLSLTKLVLFILSTLVYLGVGFALYFTSFDANGILIESRLSFAKLFLVVLTVLHWNMISYLFPCSSLFAFAPFFLIITAFFMDEKLVVIEGMALIASIAFSWALLGDKLLPAPGFDFAHEMTIRVEAILFTMIAVYTITRLCNTLMVRELESLSYYDPLTRLRNRRGMNELIEKARLDLNSKYSIGMFDIDDFKDINDTYGHDYGDVVLKQISNLLTRGTNKNDLVFRYGGEEFLVLFNCNGTTAEKACNRLIRIISEEKFEPMPGVELHITLTAGVAELSKYIQTHDSIVLSDENMYRGKKAGKNCVVYTKNRYRDINQS